MKSFKINEEASEPYRFKAMDGVAESMAVRINEMIIKAYHKGAEEMRKSLRCASCDFHINGICEDLGFMCGKRTPDNFGCINYSEEEKS